MSLKGIASAFFAVMYGVLCFTIGSMQDGDYGGFIVLAIGVVIAYCFSVLKKGNWKLKALGDDLSHTFTNLLEASKGLLTIALVIVGILVVIGLVAGLFNWVSGLSATTVIIILLVLILLK